MKPPAVKAVKDAARRWRETIRPQADAVLFGSTPLWAGWAIDDSFVAGYFQGVKAADKARRDKE